MVHATEPAGLAAPDANGVETMAENRAPLEVWTGVPGPSMATDESIWLLVGKTDCSEGEEASLELEVTPPVPVPPAAPDPPTVPEEIEPDDAGEPPLRSLSNAAALAGAALVLSC